MKQKIEVLDYDTVRVTSQAKILGFIDTGSVVTDVYKRVNLFDWRSTTDGYKAEFPLSMDIRAAVDAWQFLKSLDQPTE